MPLFQTTWLTVFGVALIFVGGFVLWVYGQRHPRSVIEVGGPESDATRQFHSHLVQWFFLYGFVALVAGLGCLLEAATAMF